ncbi:activator of prop osmoprotectant transporter [Legionella israelensis]|uniref:Activator of prop osmoprotectant transporter n=1 Tax=Legionella israelensis TaxID=454 RepID=A0AAX1EJF9_9GAMM|nr:ProQ/FinO family protein [Legionella israelensis]QBR85248.1 activator of prop osmoprotectant transporter [Legionella israelensis]
MRKQELHPRTAVINRSQKNKSKQARLNALRWLADRFPEAFNNKLRIRPLKKGIMNDLLEYAEEAAEAGISKSKLREAVILFTRRIDYLACLKAQETRIDLHGNAIDKVSSEEAERAAIKIKRRVEKSARNARKTNAKAPMEPYYYNNSTDHHDSYRSSAEEHEFPVYPSRSSYNNAGQNSKTPSVVIKHKASKSYDPEAVARLKEKLGLSKRESTTK